MLEPGDKVCYKNNSTKVAVVRDASYNEGMVLLDWPHGAISAAYIDDLLLVQSNEPVLGVGNPNKTFKRKESEGAGPMLYPPIEW